MCSAILATRLYVPPLRPEVVLRPRLVERLKEGLHRKLTLVSAAAGFGKTTLVSEWVADTERRTAWLSLDEGDSDPSRFLTYLVAALQTVEAHIGAAVLGGPPSPQPTATEAVLTTLLNDIATAKDDFTLVLDDYHRVDAEQVDEALTFLLEHLPPQMHLVIATREDPRLPLARLRARGQMTEVRAADLRFTPDEAATFLDHMTGLELSAEDVTSLETRTEGWIAGLQLAALSMRGRDDVAGFIRAFAGDNRYVVDYLVEEVLGRQPPEVRSFLLQTSILDRLSAPLCDAVTGQAGGAALLETLERGNLFLIPLDDRRKWFRYHHLFGDVIHAHALEELHERMSTLHGRASDWYERNDLPAEAIHHALAGEDFERAAALIELARPAMEAIFQSDTWLRWAKALPEEVVRGRPVLIGAIGWAHLDVGEIEAGGARIEEAEEWLDGGVGATAGGSSRSGEMVVADEEQLEFLPFSMATARSYCAQARGDVPAAVQHARRAVDLTPEGDHLRAGQAGSLLGLASWTMGDLEAAHQALSGAMAGFERAGIISYAISVTRAPADILTTQGRLREALAAYERSLRQATEQGEPAPIGTAELYLGLSDLARERGELDAARSLLQKSESLGETAGLPDFAHRVRLVEARFRTAEGDLDRALELLDEAEGLFYRSPAPQACPVAAMKARVWLAQGKLQEARAWAREQSLSVDDELSYVREFEHITLARLLLAEHRTSPAEEGALAQATALLDRLLEAAEGGGRMGSAIEILILQALADRARGNTSAALVPLERALALAEPEGYVRTFVDEGAPMASLLATAAARDISAVYVRRLQGAFDAESHGSAAAPSPAEPPRPPAAPAQPLVEPLSKRELEVLRLIAQGLSNNQICERLFVALSTVKGHNLRIFNKLQVKRRTEAVARARELGLL